MMKQVKNLLLFLLLCVADRAVAQDTAALIKEFNKVMSFSIQPYLYYTTNTKIEAVPVVEPGDTMSMTGEFYKYENNIYYSNKLEEMFLEDSLYIQVNHGRKSIWISKVDQDTKQRMNVLPLSNKSLQDLFKSKYTISKTVINKENSQLNFAASQFFDSVSVIMVNIGLQYSGKNFLPQMIEMNIDMKQKANDEFLQQMAAQGTNIDVMIKEIDNIKYLVRNQRVSISFDAINNSKEKATEIPLWTTRLKYDAVKDEFVAKEMYRDYEITKTF